MIPERWANLFVLPQPECRKASSDSDSLQAVKKSLSKRLFREALLPLQAERICFGVLLPIQAERICLEA